MDPQIGSLDRKGRDPSPIIRHIADNSGGGGIWHCGLFSDSRRDWSQLVHLLTSQANFPTHIQLILSLTFQIHSEAYFPKTDAIIGLVADLADNWVWSSEECEDVRATGHRWREVVAQVMDLIAANKNMMHLIPNSQYNL